jgi:transposase-like protein
MTQEKNGKTIESICEVLIENGIPGMREALEKVINLAMQLERDQALQAKPYERTPERQGYANGYKERDLQTRMGSLELRIPQVRGFSFYPRSLEKGLRSERALKVAVAEMYLQGVSTRKVKAITEELCGYSISSTEVSRVARVLDEEIEKWRKRPLGIFPYVYLDARYEKVRHEGTVRDLAVLWAMGANELGQREVLGVSVSLSEAEVHWRAFLEDLQARGLKGVKLIISDDHAGLQNARKTIFSSVPWQRCQFHLAQNAQSYVPKQGMKAEVAQDIRDIFNAPSLEIAEELLKQAIEKYSKKAAKLSEWMEGAIPQGFTVHQFPRSHHRRIRTVNSMERMNLEIRRRTRVATLFPNEASCLRLVGAVLLEIHEEWVTGKKYLNMEDLNRHLAENENRIYRKKVA